MAQNTHDDGPQPPSGSGSPYDDSRIHPGWADQPQSSYDEAHSGGWGAPGHPDTGPIRLTGGDGGQQGPGAAAGSHAHGHPDEGSSSYGQDAFGQAGYVREAPSGQGATAADPRGHADPHETFAAPTSPGHESRHGAPTGGGPSPSGGPRLGPPPSSPAPASSSLYGPPPPAASPGGTPSYGPGYGPGYGPTAYGAPGPHQHQPGPWQPTRRGGLGAVFDFGFVGRATRALAPLLFWLVVAWGVVSVLNVIVVAATAPAFTRNGGTVFFAILTALFDALVRIALARLFLELCVNVSDMAERRSSAQR